MRVGEIWKSKMSILEVKIVAITKHGDDNVITLRVKKTSENGYWWSEESGINITYPPLEFMFLMMRTEFIKAFNKVYDEGR